MTESAGLTAADIPAVQAAADDRLALGADDIPAVLAAAASWPDALRKIVGFLAGPPPIIKAQPGRAGWIELKITVVTGAMGAKRPLQAVLDGLEVHGYGTDLVPSPSAEAQFPLAPEETNVVTRTVLVTGPLVDDVRAAIDQALGRALLVTQAFAARHPKVGLCAPQHQSSLYLRYALSYLIGHGLLVAAPDEVWQRYLDADVRQPFAGDVATLVEMAVNRGVLAEQIRPLPGLFVDSPEITPYLPQSDDTKGNE